MKFKTKFTKTVILSIILLFALNVTTHNVYAENKLNLEAPAVTVLTNRTNALKLQWNEVNDADYYMVYRTDDKKMLYIHIGKTKNTYFIDKNVEKNKAYFYRVLAVAENGDTVVKSKASKLAESALVTLKTPQIILSEINKEKIKLSWKIDGEAEYYKIYRKKDGGKFKLLTTEDKTVNYFYDSELLDLGCEYTYKIKSVKKISGKEYSSKDSNYILFAPPDDWQSEQRKPKIDNEWAYFLINKQNYLLENYIDNINLETVNNTKQIDARCAEYAKQMFSDAKKAGCNLTVVSGFRSISTQTYNLNAFVNQFINNGYDKNTAYAKAILEIAPPGASEHNAALALDILPSNNLYLSQDFDQTKEFKWLYENSWKYGFIMRYPKGKTDITGYIYEPWHYRFIGLYHAEKIYKSGLCLEEYMLI